LIAFANYLLDKGAKYFRRLRRIKPSNKPLIIKIYQIFICFVVFIIVLNILNIKLASLAFLVVRWVLVLVCKKSPQTL
jgi:small-conductance mechanosensitive channel